MRWLVCQLDAPARRDHGVGGMEMERSSHVKNIFMDQASATAKAQSMAMENPGVQYAVFGVVEIVEALKPAAPKLIRKTINENGEVVVAP